MIIPDYREIKHSNELYHYGMPRRSGRYPWGSGDRPYQSIPRRISKKVKDTYNKLPQPVKTAARIGAKVAGSVLISQALGTVGGYAVNALVGQIHTTSLANQSGLSLLDLKENLSRSPAVEHIVNEGKTKGRKLAEITYDKLTTAIASGSIGAIVVSEGKKKKE